MFPGHFVEELVPFESVKSENNKDNKPKKQLEEVKKGGKAALEVKPSSAYGGKCKGMLNISSFMKVIHWGSLNESDEHPFPNCLNEDNEIYLESDCEEQLSLSLAFYQNFHKNNKAFNCG